jgi:hypothetical protein
MLASRSGVAHSNSAISLTAVRQFDRPLQDEWGIFDPRQAGLEALLRKVLSRAKDIDAPHELTLTLKAK